MWASLASVKPKKSDCTVKAIYYISAMAYLAKLLFLVKGTTIPSHSPFIWCYLSGFQSPKKRYCLTYLLRRSLLLFVY